MKSIKKNALFGLSWTMFEYILFIILQLSQLAVLARILTPEDFGIYAIGMFFTTLGNSVFALGMGPALIQKQGDVTEYIDTAWSTNLLISIFAFVLLLTIIPTIVGGYFKNTEAIMPSLVLSSVVFISGLNNIGMVIYRKKIELKKIFILNIVPKIIGVVFSIMLSIYFMSYWGLVVGIIMEYCIRVFLSYYLTPIRPKFKVDKDKFFELYSFGGWLQLKNLFSWLTNNMDTFVIGMLTSTSMLGFYSRAMTIARLPESLILRVINTISFPLLSHYNNSESKFQATVEVNNDLVLLLTFPIILISQFFGEAIVLIILGDKWLEMTEVFQLLIIAISIQAYLSSYTPVIRSLGYTKLEFILFLFKILILLVTLYPLVDSYGIKGAAYAIILANILVVPYMIINISKIIKLNFKNIVSSFFISLATLLLSYMIALNLNIHSISEPIYMIIDLGILLIIYFVIIYLLYYITGLGPVASVIKIINVVRHRRYK